jgi:hypothetical protein
MKRYKILQHSNAQPFMAYLRSGAIEKYDWDFFFSLKVTSQKTTIFTVTIVRTSNFGDETLLR